MPQVSGAFVVIKTHQQLCPHEKGDLYLDQEKCALYGWWFCSGARLHKLSDKASYYLKDVHEQFFTFLTTGS